ncbi:MAG TPA: hypothetical protein VIT92_15440, partial [Burkholderiaceae bacterium]
MMMKRMQGRMQWLLLMLALLAAGPGQADPLTTLETTALPALPAPLERLLAVDGRMLALTPSGPLLLAEDRKSWQNTAWQPGGTVAASASRGAQSFVLFGKQAGSVEQAARLNVVAGAVQARPLPFLPLALRNAQAAVLGEKLYVAGADSSDAARLYELDTAAPQPAWTALEAWPEASAPSSLSAQNSALYLTLPGAAGDRLLRWKAKEGWSEKKPALGTLLPSTAHATGQAHILYLARSGAQQATRLLSFHTITGSWADLGPIGAGGAVVASGGGWGNGLIWTRPGAQGTELAVTELSAGKKLLRPFDWFIIVAYLAGMLGIGYYCYVREKRNSTADFFVGGRSIPFWAAGISLYAANTSSISYIAIPAKAFETNWQYMTNNLIAAGALGFVAIWIVPLLRRLDLMSVFHYLEIRFHPMIRTLSSLICIVVQIGSRMSVILLLPSLAIATITGIAVEWSILIMGGFTIVYTAMGGMKAVVWTDFVQLFVKMGGAIFAIGFIIYKLDGGVAEFFATSLAENKMKTLDFSWDLTKPTVWGFIFLVVFDVILTFPKDQVLMQRVLSTGSGRDAMRSTITFALISIPGGVIFYTIGTALYAFYKSHPERMNPLLNIDATFPLFIAAELPVGVTGLIIAGILAAAMATLSGIMNSVATLASVDF